MRTRRETPQQTSVANRLRHALGLRRWFVVDGVRYREVTSDSMRRALSRKGPGFKEFDVVFPDTASMHIRASAERVFADLSGPDRFTVYTRAERLLLPGMRVLILPGGTGYAGQWAASRVAPSGAIVSLEPDEQSVAYSRHRYPSPNISFEPGGLSDLAGETDGAFDAALLVHPLAGTDPERTLSEIWRLIAPGGWLLAAAPTGPAGESWLESASLICRDQGRSTMSLMDRSADWISAVFRRPIDE